MYEYTSTVLVLRLRGKKANTQRGFPPRNACTKKHNSPTRCVRPSAWVSTVRSIVSEVEVGKMIRDGHVQVELILALRVFSRCVANCVAVVVFCPKYLSCRVMKALNTEWWQVGDGVAPVGAAP